jgi:hypothetical protein
VSGVPSQFDLTSLLDRNAYSGGTKLIISGTMQLVHEDDGLDMKPVWTAEVFDRPNQRKCTIRLVGDSPKALFDLLSALAEAGEVTIHNDKEDDEDD